MILYNSFGLYGPRFPPWSLPAFLTSFTALPLSPTKQSCSHLKSLCAYCCPCWKHSLPSLHTAGSFLSPRVQLKCHFPDHPIPFCFLLCTPSLSSAHSYPINAFYSRQSTHHYPNLFVYLCPSSGTKTARREFDFDLDQAPRTVSGTKHMLNRMNGGTSTSQVR